MFKINIKKFIEGIFLILILGFFINHISLPVLASLEDIMITGSGQNGGGITAIGQQGFKTTGEPADPTVIIAFIIKTIIGFLGIIFVVKLIIAGFQYMTSEGSGDKMGEAMGKIKTSIIGMIIVLSAFAIVSFVFNSLINSKSQICKPPNMMINGVCMQPSKK